MRTNFLQLIAMTMLLAGAAALAIPASACDVPVFRYALERWEPELFRICAVVTTEPPPPVQDEFGKLFGAAAHPAAADASNIELSVLSPLTHPFGADKATSPPSDDIVPQLVEKNFTATTLVAFPPRSVGQHIMWSRPLTVNSATELLTSPARASTVNLLLRGAATVWLLFEEGDKEKDDALESSLRSTLAKTADALLKADEALRQEVAASGSPSGMPERPPLPALSFPIVRIAKDAPEERFLIAMLKDFFANASGGQLEPPFIVPVFGRGRALTALAGSEVSESFLLKICTYLVGPCSCEAKELNPGVDLLISADWAGSVAQTITDARALPPLVGAGDIAAPPPPPPVAAVPSTLSRPLPERPPEPQSTSLLSSPNLLLAALSLVAALILLTMSYFMLARD